VNVRWTWTGVVLLCLVATLAACNMPPKTWDAWDATPDGDSDGDADADADGEPDGSTDADVDGTGDADADEDADEPVGDLCEGVFCFPDEECDPATGLCTSEGLECGEILSCWMDSGMDLTNIFPCLLEGSAEGRRDFTNLVTCLAQNCLAELLGAASDPMPLGMCAFEGCPDELMPCAGGFF